MDEIDAVVHLGAARAREGLAHAEKLLVLLADQHASRCVP